MSRIFKILLAAAVLALGTSPVAQSSIPELAFDTNADLLRTPNDIYVGEIGGVGQNSKGQIFVYTRTGHPYATLGDNRTFSRGGSRLFQFDQNGKFVRELGQDVYGFNAAIGLRVDPQDNVWTIDAAANQVVKFLPDGSIALVLGRKPETIAVRPPQPGAGRGGEGRGAPGAPGAGGRGRGGAAGPPGSGVPGSAFNRPTDVAWDKAGNIYVADGIGNNNRVAKFRPDGSFIKHWGSTGEGQGQFRGVKAIAIDAQGNVYVADMGNKRIQVFDNNGTFKTQFTNVGAPRAICISPGPQQFLYSSNSNPTEDPFLGGEIYKLRLDGTVVGKFGSAGKQFKEFGMVNAIDCRDPNTLYVAELMNWRVQKLTLRNEPGSTATREPRKP